MGCRNGIREFLKLSYSFIHGNLPLKKRNLVLKNWKEDEHKYAHIRHVFWGKPFCLGVVYHIRDPSTKMYGIERSNRTS